MDSKFTKRILTSLLLAIPSPLVLGGLITILTNAFWLNPSLSENQQGIAGLVALLGSADGIIAYLIAVCLFGGVAFIALNLSAVPADDFTDFPDEEDGDRESGTVKWFNVSKGFGFITRDSGEEIFVHFRSIRGRGHRSLRQGQRVRFSVSQGEKGLQADNVSVAKG
ncbi:cold shock protein [Oleiphilus messinensis]|uniref:Cold shock protein n=1 Tax=Oleiphilus messinensis TaxID=141451 RepID=A0A1Y0I9C6_9GAMM|nr:cold-shock protein [Oleiphilus messinensis]ARU56034.1 cold shock protein [Oleiphilus messinensis]